MSMHNQCDTRSADLAIHPTPAPELNAANANMLTAANGLKPNHPQVVQMRDKGLM
jgi:hypothetical protein